MNMMTVTNAAEVEVKEMAQNRMENVTSFAV